MDEQELPHDLPDDDTSSTFSAYLIRALLSVLGSPDDGTSGEPTNSTVVVLTFLMRFASAVLVLVLTRHAANAIATSIAGNGANTVGTRSSRPAAALLGRRAASLQGGSAVGDEPSPRRIPLLGRLATSAYGTGDDENEDTGNASSSAAAAFGRSRSMAVPSSVTASSASTAAAAVQFKPLGSVPPIPPGTVAGPHYVFLVHGWLGNEQEMAYLGTALEDVVAGRVLSTSIENDQQDDNNKDDPDEDDGFVHVTANDGNDEGNVDEQQEASVASVESDEESQEDRPDIVVHKPSCNNGRTTDGIAAGGTRLAEEVAEFIVTDIRDRRKRRQIGNESEVQDDGGDFEEHVTISFVGNSLGGLYSRYALSLLPSELRLDAPKEDDASSGTIILHPNTFCTTATPHLGCSSNTYIPVPRFAERAIGRVLDVTGLDLFRADCEDYPASPQKKEGNDQDASPRSEKKKDKENVENDADDDGEARDDEPLLPSASSSNANEGKEGKAENEGPKRDLIYRMCTEPAYLKPLSSFRRRIAYANAFGTDFQVPCNTASFLSDKSTYPHRYCNDAEKEDLDFIASVLYTDPSDVVSANIAATSTGDDQDAEDDILVMSKCLDALGWTKVFIDTRSGIPVPALPKPAFMKKLQRQSTGFDARNELRNFVTRRKSSVVGIPGESPIKAPEGDDPEEEMPVPESLQRRRDERPEDATSTSEEEKVELLDTKHLSSVAITLESRELVELMNPSERMHFPLGHTVMVANSKSGFYSKINAKGKPVMNKLAMDLVSQISGFEYM